jgi:hypothetical protein
VRQGHGARDAILPIKVVWLEQARRRRPQPHHGLITSLPGPRTGHDPQREQHDGLGRRGSGESITASTPIRPGFASGAQE